MKVKRCRGYFLIDDHYKMNRLGQVWKECPDTGCQNLIQELPVPFSLVQEIRKAVEQAGWKVQLTQFGNKIYTSKR